jgi:hypothetical protein
VLVTDPRQDTGSGILSLVSPSTMPSCLSSAKRGRKKHIDPGPTPLGRKLAWEGKYLVRGHIAEGEEPQNHFITLFPV